MPWALPISPPWSLLPLPRRLLDRITNKRELLARAFGSLGLIGLLEQIALRRPALVVLTYHRIAVPGNTSNPYYDPVISATPDAFEAQIRFLSTRFHILGLQALLNIAADKGMNARVLLNAGKPIALVTFDDGYRDHCETALLSFASSACRRRSSSRPGFSTQRDCPGGTTLPVCSSERVFRGLPWSVVLETLIPSSSTWNQPRAASGAQWPS